MRLVAEAVVLLGALLILVGAVGLHRFAEPLAHLHAAGKAASFGVVLVLVGAGTLLGPAALGEGLLAAVLLVATVPIGVHVLTAARDADDRGPTGGG